MIYWFCFSFSITFSFLMFLCRSFAQRRHLIHSGGAGEPQGQRETTEPSSAAAAPPAVSLAALQWPVYCPSLGCCGLVTTVWRKHKCPVCGELFDSWSNVCAATEVSIERHLEDILNNNKQAVVGAFQTEIKKTLKAQNRRKKASQASYI